MFELKIPCRMRISCHCLNIKHRWARIVWAHAVRQSPLFKHSWRCINSPQSVHSTHCCFVIDMSFSTQYSPSSVLKKSSFCDLIAFSSNGEGVSLLLLQFFAEMRREANWPTCRWLFDLSSCCRSLRQQKSPAKPKTNLIMVIIWNKEQSFSPLEAMWSR